MNMNNLRAAILSRIEAQIRLIETMPDTGKAMPFADARDWVVAALVEAHEAAAWTNGDLYGEPVGAFPDRNDVAPLTATPAARKGEGR